MQADAKLQDFSLKAGSRQHKMRGILTLRTESDGILRFVDYKSLPSNQADPNLGSVSPGTRLPLSTGNNLSIICSQWRPRDAVSTKEAVQSHVRFWWVSCSARANHFSIRK